MWRLIVLAPVLGGIVVVAAICSTLSSSDAPSGGGGLYVSLGDSIAAGVGASDPEASGFAPVLADIEGVELRNLAQAGALSTDVLEHQVPEFQALAAEREIAFVTISAGGNDLGLLVGQADCLEDPLPASCPLAPGLFQVAARLDQTLLAIRNADADAPVVVLEYPNFFSGTAHPFEDPAERVLPLLNAVIRRVAGQHEGVVVAETFEAFAGRGGDYTHLRDEHPDPHPNDAGHRLIAQAFALALPPA
jgi:lysophospholipase L1-like esterase